MDLDDRLVGHWSSVPFSYGVMEASELGLLADGQGWSSWFNADALCVTRLRWRCPEPGVLELHARWSVQGTPGDGPGSPAFATMEPAEPLAEVTRHRYVLGPVEPMPGADPLAAVTFEEPVEFCHHFAAGPKEISAEEDPTFSAVPYQ
ncbi:hypothetical protein ITI46_17290 [Streptomyces oryzae]|uniref:Uncharacterized protein n=1 Tax=Streptomyces oryzae TaxID=1434886 RepID=A0ABS3XE80_9ACTN|nr:hypothetical protein [Streptomyces oryzae]MBO8193401.1 hypothetical protein [Streptomyces oryzae]